jgi:ParB family chromosome partitioning protein
MKKLFGLGKGLGSLIPTDAAGVPAGAQKENVFYVEVSRIRANPNQPRRDFEEESLRELSKSIRKHGVLQPLLVSKVENQTSRGLEVYYHLIAGERRLRASQLAGLPQVPVIIRDDMDEEKDRLEIALVENLQRKDLNPVEEAEAYEHLSKEFSLTQKEIAEKVSKSREYVANAVRILNLPKDVREALRGEKISRSHAKALLAIADPIKQKEVFAQILSGRLSSKEAESVASATKAKAAGKPDSKFIELEKNLGETLSVPVFIKSAEKGGRIIIKFATLEELNKIAKNIID